MTKVVKFQYLFPIGYIYISTSSQNPSKWFGGTWTAIGQGRCLVGINTSDSDFNTVKKTGGAKTHTLTEAQIPSHRHISNDDAAGLFAGWGTKDSGGWVSAATNTSKGGNWATAYTGGGQAHNNLQPYLVVYMWERTA